MKRYLNQMLMTLFKHYRKKEDASLAIFSSRMTIVLITIIYLMDIYLALWVYKFINIPFPRFSSRWTMLPLALPFLVVIYLIIYFNSEKKEYFEEEQPYKEELQEGQRYITFFALGSILGFIILIFFH